jgi:hypothetical protein
MAGKTLYVGRAQKKAERQQELKKKFEMLKLERLNRWKKKFLTSHPIRICYTSTNVIFWKFRFESGFIGSGNPDSTSVLT